MRRSVKVVLWALFLVYLLILLRITVFRSDFGSHPLLQDGQIVWVPFVGLYQILKNSPFYFLYLFIGNLIWFVPLGLLLPPLTGIEKPVVLVGLLLSLGIEILQYVFGTGVTEVEDLILNTLGTILGYGLWRFWKAWRRRTS